MRFNERSSKPNWLKARPLPRPPETPDSDLAAPTPTPREMRIAVVILIAMCVGCFLLGYSVARWTGRQDAGPTPGKPGPRAAHTEGHLNGLAMTMAPAGYYLIGPPEGAEQIGDTPLPKREKVTIPQPFWLSQCEVTKGQWEQVMGTRPWASRPNVHDDSDTPAVYVSYWDAVEFCERLSAATGRVWRLPTAVEWECAARAGTDSEYPLRGDKDEHILIRKETAWRLLRYEEFPWAPWVAMGDCNAWGLYDTMDNVREWCAPTDGASSGDKAIVRGSGWRAIGIEPLWVKHEASKGEKGDDMGFRVVCEGPGSIGDEEGLFAFSDAESKAREIPEFALFAPRPETTPAITLTEEWPLAYQHPSGVEAHSSNINAIAVSPEGDQVASICGDMKLKLWSLSDQRKLNEWHTGIAWEKMRLSSGARYAAMTDAFKGASKLMGLSYDITMSEVWDLETGQSVWKSDDECVDLCFSPDGRFFAFLGVDTVEIYATTDWTTPVRTIPDMAETIGEPGPTMAGFSADSARLTILSCTSRHVYRVDDGAPVLAAEAESVDWPVEKAALHIGEPSLALAATGAKSRFVRFRMDGAGESPFAPPIPATLGARHFNCDGTRYLEYSRHTGLLVMTVPFFAQVQRVPVPLDEFEPVAGLNAIVATSGRHLFLLDLDSPDRIGYFLDNEPTEE